MTDAPSTSAAKRHDPTFWVWSGLLVLAALVMVYLLFVPQRPADDRGPNYPGVGVELSTVKFDPLTGDPAAISKHDLQGKVAVVNFWGPWCHFCREEMPHLLKMEQRFSSDPNFRLILVSNSSSPYLDVDSLREDTAEYMKSIGADRPTHYDPNYATLSALAKDAKLPNIGFPITAVLDGRGVLRGLWMGYMPGDDDAMNDLVTQLLKAPLAEAPRRAEPAWSAQVAAVRSKQTNEIVVEESVVTDDDLALLADASNLKILSIEQAQVTDAGLQHLSSLANLERLKLRGAAVGDDGLQHLQLLKKLKSINLPQARFTDDGLAMLAKLPQLEQLRIGSPNVTDAGLEHVAGMSRLRFLHLIDTPITDAGLAHLHGMKQLESFYLDGGHATDDGLSRLLKAIPGLHIHIDQQHLDYDPHAHTHKHTHAAPE